jgi:hypothetical protein
MSNGNLDISTPTGWLSYVGTIAMNTGKWYWEYQLTSGPYAVVGVRNDITTAGNPPYISGAGYYSLSGAKESQAGGGVPYGASWNSSNIIGIAFDADAGTITFYRDNVSQGQAFSNLTSGPYYPHVGLYQSGGTFNFGQRAFAYTAPSGFKALCTQNLPEGTITTSGTYTGNGVADGPFVYLNGVPTAMTVGGNAVTFGTHADKLSNGFKLRTTSTTYNQNALSYSYSITTTGAKFKYARAQPNP